MFWLHGLKRDVWDKPSSLPYLCMGIKLDHKPVSPLEKQVSVNYEIKERHLWKACTL